MSASKRKGTAWERAVVEFLRARGAVHAERRALAGARDRGDVAGIPGVVIECKAAKRYELAEWIRELEAETVNAGAEWGFLAVKAPRRPVADAYVVMRLDHLPRLLEQLDAIPSGTTPSPPGQAAG